MGGNKYIYKYDLWRLYRQKSGMLKSVAEYADLQTHKLSHLQKIILKQEEMIKELIAKIENESSKKESNN